MMNVLEIRDLTKSYGGFTLDGLTLALPSGCIMGLVGENGAGKSTTIKLILDMIRRDAGSISIFGIDDRSRMAVLKEDIGVVLDEAGIPECLTAAQAGRVMRSTFKNWSDREYGRYLERLSIPDNRKFKEFSRGMKMKLCIAIAMSHDPKLLIFDEATSGLDPAARDDVTDMLCEFTRDESHAVLMSSHIVSDLEKICDYIAFLHEGRLLLCEEKDMLFERYGLVHLSDGALSELAPSAIMGSRRSAYGAEAIVRRDQAPKGADIRPISIEELFVFMVKGDR